MNNPIDRLHNLAILVAKAPPEQQKSIIDKFEESLTGKKNDDVATATIVNQSILQETTEPPTAEETRQALNMGKSQEHNKSYQGVNYVFTSFEMENYQNWQTNWKFLNEQGINYMCFQGEQCPVSLKHHIQGYIELTKTFRYKTLQDLLEDKVYLAKRMGTQLQAIAYCKKPESALKDFPFLEMGERKNQGERTDIKNLVENIEAGASYEFVRREFGNTVFLHDRTTRQWIQEKQEKKIPAWNLIDTTVIIGQAGCGKSFTPRKIHGDDNIHIVDYDQNAKWWDGYEGQEAIIFEEFVGQISRDKMLQLLDIYNIKLQNKRGYTKKGWKYVYITSNIPPEKWWPNVLTNKGEKYNCMKDDAFSRRIKNILRIDKTILNKTRKPVDLTIQTDDLEYILLENLQAKIINENCLFDSSGSDEQGTSGANC